MEQSTKPFPAPKVWLCSWECRRASQIISGLFGITWAAHGGGKVRPPDCLRPMFDPLFRVIQMSIPYDVYMLLFMDVCSLMSCI